MLEAESKIDLPDVLSYSEELYPENFLSNLWHILKEEKMVESVFHGEINNLNAFIKFMLSALLFIGVNNDEIVAAAWLYNITGRKAEVGLFVRRKYFAHRDMLFDLWKKFLDKVFDNFEINRIVGYTHIRLKKTALAFGFNIAGVIPAYFANGDDALVVYY
jgi:hypothetical protein